MVLRKSSPRNRFHDYVMNQESSGKNVRTLDEETRVLYLSELRLTSLINLRIVTIPKKGVGNLVVEICNLIRVNGPWRQPEWGESSY